MAHDAEGTNLARTLLCELLGAGAHFTYSRGFHSGASNTVWACDADGNQCGCGQTEAQALRDAREHAQR